MGDRLLAFVREVLRQRELLEKAMDRDDLALGLMREDNCGRRNRPQWTGHRRVWTRRDKRLLDASDHGGTGSPRTQRILGRLRPERGEGPHIPLLREALDEARRDGTFSHLAPILQSLADAHVAFFNHAAEVVAEQLADHMRFPYGDVKELHDEAVSRVMPFLPPGAAHFDEQYPWDRRHESRVLYRDLRQPASRSEDINAGKLDAEHGNQGQRERGQVFISYSHEDKRWLDDLQTHLKPYLRDGSMTAWSDQQIATGSKSFPEIQAALARTSVAVLLVTPDFLASDFIHEHELAPLLKEAERGGVRIVWIPVRPSAFTRTPLKDYQAVIDPERPLAKMKKADRDDAWVKICKEIDKAVKP